MQAKLNKSNIEDIIPLTSMQEGMLFHYLKEPEALEYHEQISLGLEGDVDPDLMQKAWDFVVENNEMLRTVFRWKNINNPVQVILKNKQVVVHYYDLSGEESEKKLDGIKAADLGSRLDIEQETLRVALCKCGERAFTMIITNHHILYDGWSSSIIIKELINAYQSLAEGLKPRATFKNKFSEYVKWMGSQDKTVQKRYWENYLLGAEQTDDLFSKASVSEMKSYEYVLGKEMGDQLTEFAKELGLSVATILYAAWGILAGKLNNTHDLMFGITTSGRNPTINGIENMVGLFINTIPLRIQTDAEATIFQLLNKVHKTTKELDEIGSTPLVDINAYAGFGSQSQLFNSLVVIENYPLNMKDYQGGSLVINHYSAMERTNYNLTLGITIPEGVVLNFRYNCFADDQLIMSIAQYFKRMLAAMMLDKDRKVIDIELLSAAERAKILYEFNDTFVSYQGDKTIPQLFTEQVAKTPNNPALVFEEQCLTYDELNKKSNQLARLLREEGVKPDHIVGIMTQRSPLMIMGILAILKAGGAYLPIDPSYPMERIQFMLADSGTSILLTQLPLGHEVKFGGKKINLDQMSFGNIKSGADQAYDLNLDEVDTANLELVNTASDLAYVIYTSGSTGVPKGVMVEHKSVINLLYDMEKHYPLRGTDAYLLKTAYAFDVSVPELFGGFVSGSRLVILPQGHEQLPAKIMDAICRHRVTHVSFVPSMLNVFLEAVREMAPKDINQRLGSLRYVLVAGEALRQETVKLFYQLFQDIKLENLHGPTEATVYDTRYPTLVDESNQTVPIGKPISNTKIYVMDKWGKIQPIGIPGELCISGMGLARGYLNQRELTAAKFVPNPYIKGERMYRTGDLARLLPDGNMEFLGRIDQQVKIRGFRIELGEIESQLLKLAAVKEAVVISSQRPRGGDQIREAEDQYLCAYLVADEEISVGEFRQHLSATLPNYMIPSFFVRLERMPLLPNGKIDKKAMPAPKSKVAVEYVAPRNTMEAMLVRIWSEVLDRESVGVDDNFFELGGHSLKATILASRIHKELRIELPLKALFDKPTISEISDYLSAAKESAFTGIKPVRAKEYYEISSAQKRMWLLWQLDPSSTGYNMPSVLIMEGILDKARLEHVFSALIERHESLRTSFGTVDDKVNMNGDAQDHIIVSRVAASVEFEVEYSEHPEAEINAAIKAFIRPFDLSRASLLRVGLIRVSANRHYLLFDIHHIIADGTSLAILTQELMTLYDGGELKPQKIQYKDFSQWQNKDLNSEKMRDQEAYWLEQFSGEIPLLNLPLDYVRPTVQSFEGGSVEFRLNRETTEKLNRLAHESGATLYMVLLSAINILLAKYTGQVDIIIGSPIAGRAHADLERIIGMFVNTLAMRNYPTSDKTYKDFLKEVKETALRAYEHQDYQFEELVEKLELRRDVSRNPLFDVMFVLQNTGAREWAMKGLKVMEYLPQASAKFDLTFTATEVGHEIAFSVEYGVNLFKRETIEGLVGHLQNLLSFLVKQANPKLGEIEILSPEERQQLLWDFNDTASSYPKHKTIQQLFEEQAEKTPNNTALVFGEGSLTYHELNQKSNQLARGLREKGVKPNDIVGIMVERSPQMIIGILGVLKSGGAYLPIDPEHPQERIKFILEDSGTDILLTQSWLVARAEFKGKKISLNEGWIYENEGTNLEPVSSPGDLAYAIYTSGSTGLPKGVLMEHKAVVNMIFGMEERCPLGREDAYLLKTPYTFDASTSELFGWFVGGGKLVILQPRAEKNPEKIWKAIIQHGITHINFVPSMLNVFIDILAMNEINHLGHLKYLYTAGEAVGVNCIKKFFTTFKDTKLVNAYGPAETTYTTLYSISRDQSYSMIPVGKPLANCQIYILNADNLLVPIGIAGELCVSGHGLARGYLNRPELTAEKFIENPFVPGERMYRTGDIARWLPDGNIEYLGRVDHQAKIRGIRIELGEIENRLLELEKVKEAVVVVGEEASGDKYLCAYLVSATELLISQLRNHLSASLPEVMIPSYFVQLEKLPLSPNGKVDLQALPKPDGKADVEYVAPRDSTEEKLAQIWSEVLGKERIGIYDNFFELGGHSLKGTVVTSRIHKELNIELPLKELFKTPTILGISDYLSKAKESVYARIEPVEARAYYRVSSAQKRMWILQQFDHNSIGYNMPGVLVIDGELDKSRLETAFSALIKRHESLRTTFEMIETDVIVQRVAASAAFEVKYAEHPEADIKAVIRDFIIPFDLSKAPLLRIGLIKTSAKRHYLLFDMHHIIADGVSMSILKSEFMALYEGKELKEQRIGYKDFAVWQYEYLKSEKMREQENYWLDQFAVEPQLLNLPFDYLRPTVQSFAGKSIEFRLNRWLTEELNSLARVTGTTLYMVLLSAVNILLFKYTNQEDIIVGSPIAGRPHADLEGIMGMFVNTLAMRNYPKGRKTFAEFLAEVKATALMAYENQDYPFEELVEKVNSRITRSDQGRDLSRHPLFDVMFVLQNMEAEKPTIEGLEFREYKLEQGSAKFDLLFTAIEGDGEILFSIEYCASLFKQETLKRLSKHFQNLLAAITRSRTIKVGDIDLLSAAERQQILYEFNDTYAQYPQEKVIHQLFEEQVLKAPHNVALVYENEVYSYSELNAKSNQLARLLRALDVGVDSIVAIMVERSPLMIVGILGILKAGAAYLPIDPDYPEERIRLMLDDSDTQVLLTGRVIGKQVEFGGTVINLDDKSIYNESALNLDKVNSSQDLAYVIYTSGSTGVPKGTLVEHKSVVRLVKNTNYLEFNDAIVMMQTGSIAFDASTFEIWGALLNGGKLVLAGMDTITNAATLKDCIKKWNVNTMWCTSSLFNQLIQTDVYTFNNLKYLLIGGEKLSEKHVSLLKEHNPLVKLINGYGPTENTTFTTTFEVVGEGKIPIGKPINNTEVYILNEQQLCGIGIPGELCIGGDGLARGYLKRPELMAEKFVANPFKPGERMYRTGDLVRWLPDGNIEFLGRSDHQVKVRGFRIELGEIEKYLLELKSVKEAVVIARSKDSLGGEMGAKYLYAYLVAAEKITPNQLRQQLALRLPDYMIPSFFVQLEKIPLTSSGKVDWKAMPAPDGEAGVAYVAPRNTTEEILAQIWSEVLEQERVGIDDNFFDLGGHSLKATMVASRIHQELKISLPLKELFRRPTISRLSDYLCSARASMYAGIQPVAPKEYYVASYTQKRMWILNQLTPNSPIYNMPGRITLFEEVDHNIIQEIFDKLFTRHEAFRTRFSEREGEVVQIIEEKAKSLVETIDLTPLSLAARKQERTRIYEELATKIFDLAVDQLIEVKLIKIHEKEYDLIFCMHHIIFDGWSLDILKKEFFIMYEAYKRNQEYELPPLRIQYKDFAQWQNRLIKNQQFSENARAYWLNQLSEEISSLNLPTDYPLDDTADKTGSAYKIVVNKQMKDQLKAQAREFQTSLFIVLITTFISFLSELTKQDDILIGVPTFGRGYEDLQNVIGCFVNTTIIRNKISSEASFVETLKKIDKNTLAAIEYQDYPLELVVDELNIKYPQINAFFNMLNFDESATEYLVDLEAEHIIKTQDVKFDFEWYVTEYLDAVKIVCVYNAGLFKPKTIEYIMNKYTDYVIKILENPHKSLKAYFASSKRRKL